MLKRSLDLRTVVTCALFATASFVAAVSSFARQHETSSLAASIIGASLQQPAAEEKFGNMKTSVTKADMTQSQAKVQCTDFAFRFFGPTCGKTHKKHAQRTHHIATYIISRTDSSTTSPDQ
jgi:hypothetical protein